MDNKPTKEQERIFKFTKLRPENILIKAYAGAGKTTTMRIIRGLLLDYITLLPNQLEVFEE